MASREMIDVLQRLRELDEKNPNVHNDALENTEKMNGTTVTEAEFKKGDKVKVDGKETTITVPNGPGDLVGVDKDGKTDMVKSSKVKKLDESITISADSPEDLPVIAQIMKLAGMNTVTPDMMPDTDNVPMMKPDDNINGSPCGGDENPVVTKRDGVDFDLDRDGMPDITYDNSPDESYQGVEAVTTDAGTDGLNGTNHPQDIRVKDASPYADYEQRLAKLAGIENEGRYDGPNSECCDAPLKNYNDGLGICSDCGDHAGPIDDETDEGYANSMGNEKEEPTYKGYDPDYSDHTEDGKPKVRYVPGGSGDNPLESIENKLRDEYKTFKEELWNALTDGKETTTEGRGKVMAGRGRGKLMAGRGRGKVMASRGRGKMPKEDVKTTEGRGRGKAKKK